MRRVFILLVVTAFAVTLAPLALFATERAAAAEYRGTSNPVRRVKVTRDIVFPIVGATRTINGFGSCRDNCTRQHHGVDTLTYGWKGLPVVDSHDGVVTQIRDDGEWCNVQITGADGLIGNAAFEGIGRRGLRYTVYYSAGDEWVRYRARERPEEGPGYGVFLVEPQHLTGGNRRA